MNTDAERYYAVLEVDPAASDEVIRSAFRRRAKELHPDSLSGDAGAFILLKRAYDTLIDPEGRAAYDRACQPAPPLRRSDPVEASPIRPRRGPPLPPRSKPSRLGGVGFVRYVIAFLIMAAISLGGVQAMILWTAAPPSIQSRATVAPPAPGAAPSPAPAIEPSTAPGSSKSGFWDPTPPPTGKKAP